MLLGIGRPPGQMDTQAYVLQKFSASERQEVSLPFLYDECREYSQVLVGVIVLSSYQSTVDAIGLS